MKSSTAEGLTRWLIHENTEQMLYKNKYSVSVCQTCTYSVFFLFLSDSWDFISVSKVKIQICVLKPSLLPCKENLCLYNFNKYIAMPENIFSGHSSEVSVHESKLLVCTAPEWSMCSGLVLSLHRHPSYKNLVFSILKGWWYLMVILWVRHLLRHNPLPTTSC